jgi:hypothetical protein
MDCAVHGRVEPQRAATAFGTLRQLQDCADLRPLVARLTR